MSTDERQEQIHLFETLEAPGHVRLESRNWPPPERFPLNVGGRRVSEQVFADLEASQNPLIVAGYSSIDYLVDFAAKLSAREGNLRLLVGTEPFPGYRTSYSTATPFTKEVEAYWLERGISLRASAKVVQTIALLKEGRIEARYLGSRDARLHAKIYAADAAITIGSSNFTQSGLSRQIEANVRLTPKDKGRFEEARTIAENLWQSGDPFNAELLALLERLLKVVTWKEALARASAELLEGEWAREYLKAQTFIGDLPLWPSQEQGIAEAMWVLQNVGSVLVADATGSGKTRLGAHLLRAVVDRIWSRGRVRKALAVVIAPPAVNKNWLKAATEAGVPLTVKSHGKLSHASKQPDDDVTDAVRRAQVLAVDEAHNFLNPKSQRTRAILGNMADHAILFTATPINRGTVDLLRLADMLGADNLAESTVKALAPLFRRPKLDRTLTEAELENLRRELQRFTVRRTKKSLNAMVDAAPEKYRDSAGRQCRYPEHRAQIYLLGEPEADREIARQIREESLKLRGAAFLLGEIVMPEVLLQESWTEETYIDRRLKSAARLSSYLVMATLRSSRAALMEHIAGTSAALSRFGLADDAKRQGTGDQLQKLRDSGGKPPKSQLTAPLPDWLTDPAAHREACASDIAAYLRILELADQMSDHREREKVRLLMRLVRKHEIILAFDSRPITLSLLQTHLAEYSTETEVILATGERQASKRIVEERLRPGAERRPLIALCSDSMSEGVNLQLAAAVVHLDLPSVVRIAEQRVGRVDRMDSPHTSIEAWWPQDAPELALRSDERFIERYDTVQALLGSNLPLPDGYRSAPSERVEVVSADEAIATFEEEQNRWDGLGDVFAPVRDLVSGADALIDRQLYEGYRNVSTRVLARVSLVKADSPWGFVCFTGSGVGAPRWVFVTDTKSVPLVDLAAIAPEIRMRLGPDSADLPLSDDAMRWLERVLTIVQQQEISLLPRRKQLALREMKIVLREYAKGPFPSEDSRKTLDVLLTVLDRENDDEWYDWDAIAETWLDIIRPVWYERLSKRKRFGLLLLKNIRKDLLGESRIPLEKIVEHFRVLPTLPPLDVRVAACILGVP